MGRRLVLSRLDIVRINRKYECEVGNVDLGDDIPGA